MLVCKRTHRLCPPLAARFRFYSSNCIPPYNFKNIRAFPFKLSPPDAIRYMSPFAALIRRERRMETLIGSYIPSLGIEPIQPLRMTPVYFPTWFLDAEVKAEVTMRGHDRQAFVQIRDVYIPGSDYNGLSSAPIYPFDPRTQETVPFSEDLLRQFDLDIACIPYNISPFSILDVARRISYPKGAISQDLHFTPSSLHPTLIAAYPVLVPIYLLQYEYDSIHGKVYHTMFVEGYENARNIWSEAFSEQHRGLERAIAQEVRSTLLGAKDRPDDPVKNWSGYLNAYIDDVRVSLHPGDELGKATKEYLETALRHPSTPKTLAAASVDHLDSLAEDLRVREFTNEERNPINEWMKLGSELMSLEMMLEPMTQARAAGKLLADTSESGRDPMSFFDVAIERLSQKSEAIREKRRQAKPVWAMSRQELEGELTRYERERTESQKQKDSQP